MRKHPVALAVALALVVAACSGDDQPTLTPDTGAETLDAVIEATRAEGSLGYEGTATDPSGASGPVSGVSAAQPARGHVDLVTFAGGQVLEAEMAWLDDTVYVGRAEAPADVEGASLGAAMTFVRSADEARWLQSPRAGVTAAAVAPYDPYLLLDTLTSVGARLAETGTGEVDGTEVTAYQVTDIDGDPLAVTGTTFTLWADADHRLRQVRAEGPSQPTLEYAVTGFGVEVSVEAPPADQIAQSTGGSLLVASGPFEAVASGTAENGVAWTLERAPGEAGAVCWRLQTEPPVAPSSGVNPDGSRCRTPAVPGADLDDRIWFPVDASAATTFDAFVAVVPSNTARATVTLADGTSQDLAVDATNGVVVWLGTADNPALFLDVADQAGVAVGCAPGDIVGRDDLADVTPDRFDQYREYLWLCLPAES